MISDTFDASDGSRIPNSKSLRSDTSEVRLTRSRSVQTDVADDDVLCSQKSESQQQ